MTQAPEPDLRPGVAWPDSVALLDASKLPQISDGRARCTRIALCDSAGNAARGFAMGEVAHFYLEFEILEEIGVPSGGVEFHTPSGLIVHGKNSYQSGGELPGCVKAGNSLRFHQAIQLDVAPGEYQFSVGLAGAEASDYRSYRSGALGHADFEPAVLCRVIDVAAFRVTFDPKERLRHHGLADLAGSSQCVVVAPRIGIPFLGRKRSAQAQVARPPAIVHVTHWKAGSQWIHKILMRCAPQLIVAPRLRQDQFLYWPILPGGVYPTVYVTKAQYDRIALPPESQRFVVIRDLRDTLTSAYFSMKISHPVTEDGLVDLRATLLSLDFEEGMLHLMEHWLPACAAVQTSWIEADEPLVRYEDLLEHDLEILEPLLLDRCRLPVERRVFQEAVISCRFDRLTQGRGRGVEDTLAHERKGIAGDWRNHFTPRITRAFKHRFGGLLVATGYEQDLNW
jgi:lipopolysaccharide transport system ATP-binding protein